MFGIWILYQITQFCRFLALQAQVECSGMYWWGFGLKVPIFLNWVRFRSGICDGGATSSTDSWTCNKSPTQGCLGSAPMSRSKQWGIDILPIFLLRFGSSLQMCMASLAFLVIWEGSLLIMLKLEIDGKGWWKLVQCLCMADVSTWIVPWPSPQGPLMFLQNRRSYTLLPGIPNGRQCLSFGLWRSCLWGASAEIWGCSLPWNKPVWQCIWRTFCRTHSSLVNKGMKNRIVS